MNVEPVLPGDFSEREPPDSISNSEVKTLSADDSVVFRHVKVGHCQAFIQRKGLTERWALFLYTPFAMSYEKVG